MNNSGKITIFLSLTVSAMLILFSVILNGVKLYGAKTKVVTAAETAGSSIKADYNSYIFERYHILLVDKDYGGYGEGQIEALMEENLEYNLGMAYEVEAVKLCETENIYDYNCLEFKQQITDYLKYAAAEYVVGELGEAVAGTAVSEEIINDMDETVNAAENSNTNVGSMTESGTGLSDGGSNEMNMDMYVSAEDDDPRKAADNYSRVGYHVLLMPEDLELSENVINLMEVPSREYTGFSFFNDSEIDFYDYDSFKSNIFSNRLDENILNEASGIIYAPEVFKCITDDKSLDSYVNLEMEYIVCGKGSDAENYKTIVNRLLALRLPVNYAYLVTDTVKMSEITAVSVPVSIITLIPEPIVRYLIAGCWAYLESAIEVKGLLEGKSVPYVKNFSNWITDFNGLDNIFQYECEDSDNGLDYKEYLMLLMLFDLDGAYYRMLDIIELNTRMEYENFRMKNAITGFVADVSVSYEGQTFCIKKIMEY